MPIFCWMLLIVEAVGAFYAFRPWQDGDTPRYMELARSLHDGSYGISVGGQFSPEANRPPGYPMFLYFLLYVVKVSPTYVIAVQLVLYLVSIWMLAHVLQQRGFPAWFFLLLCALYPFGLGYSAKLMTEALATFILTTMVYLVARQQPFSLTIAAASGILAGFLILVRASFIFLPIFFAISIAFRCLHNCPGRFLFYRLGIFFLTSGLILLPYSIYNWKHFRNPRPLPPVGSGIVLYIGSWENELTPEDFQSLYTGNISGRALSSGFADDVSKLDDAFGLPHLTPPYAPEIFGTADQEIRGTAMLQQEAIRRIEAHPWVYLRIAVVRCWRLWNISVYPSAVPSVMRIGLQISSEAVWFFGFLGGIWLLFYRRSELTIALVLPMLYFPAIHMWLATVGRYTAPARPLIVAIALLVIVECYRSYHNIANPNARAANWP